jgi:hypothetical protein
METIKVPGRFGTVGQITHGWMKTTGAEDWYSVSSGGYGTPNMTSLKKAPTVEQIERELARLQERIRETAALYGR